MATIASYKLIPSQLYPLVAFGLPIVEIILGTLFIFNGANLLVTILVLLLFLSFEGVLLSGIIRRLTIDCGCSGGNKRGSSLKASFIRNILFLLCILWHWLATFKLTLTLNLIVVEMVVFVAAIALSIYAALTAKDGIRIVSIKKELL